MTLTPDLLLAAYRIGAFPMAEPDGQILWYAPDPRGVIPLDAFHVPRSLAKTIRQRRFGVTADRAFETVIRECASPAPGREETWISEEIVEAYTVLHRIGYAHSIECWHDGPEGSEFAGGIYGVVLGGAFFGESMTTRVRDASKVALVHLVERLRVGGFVLFDTQMVTPHTARFGAVEIPREVYERRLAEALDGTADWTAIDRADALGAAG